MMASLFKNYKIMEINFNSRRSAVYSTGGMCASSQPLASAAGAEILRKGGNAADAAVAMAAALNVTEPCSTGIGGDAFALYFDAKTKRVTCLMGNGATSKDYTLEFLQGKGYSETNPLPPRSALCISVPGAAALWEDVVKTHGSKTLSLTEVLEPAVKLAERGFPVGPVTARQWSHGVLQGDEGHRVYVPNGKTPVAGQIFRNPDLAQTFRTLGEQGASAGFYSGRIGAAIVKTVAAHGGIISQDDLSHHRTQFPEPASCLYKGLRVYETPPPTHGVAALSGLRMLEHITKDGSGGKMSRGHEYQAHIGIECMRLAYADALNTVCDPLVHPMPLKEILSDAYLSKRAATVGERSQPVPAQDYSVFSNSDTVYFCCVDVEGNGCSMINSNYMGFGTGIVPDGCGFTLHNRGLNFSLKPGHPNAAGPRKRPYHTIIPGLATREADGSLYCTFGNMGAFMQPQGHVQLIRNMVDFGLDPQSALDAPRWFVQDVDNYQVTSAVGLSKVLLERGYGGEHDGGPAGDSGQTVMDALIARGHIVEMADGFKRETYGRGQIIVRDPVTGSLCAGSDPRADGCAIPVV